MKSLFAVLFAFVILSRAHVPSHHGLRQIAHLDDSPQYCALFNAVLPGIDWSSINIPTITKSESVSGFGHVQIEAKNIAIAGPSSIQCDVTPQSSTIESLDISQAQVKITNLDWRIHQKSFPYISANGAVHAESKFTAIAALNTSVPTVIDTTVKMDDFNIHFVGKYGWVLNLLKEIIKDEVQPIIENFAQKEITDIGRKCLPDIPACLSSA